MDPARCSPDVTAMGKLMLAELGNSFVRGYSERTGLKAYTRHTRSSLDSLIEDVQEATLYGFFILLTGSARAVPIRQERWYLAALRCRAVRHCLGWVGAWGPGVEGNAAIALVGGIISGIAGYWLASGFTDGGFHK